MSDTIKNFDKLKTEEEREAVRQWSKITAVTINNDGLYMLDMIPNPGFSGAQMKPKIKLNWRRYEDSFGNTNGWGGFSGYLIGYTREDGGPSGAFAEHLLPLYDTIFEITNKEFINQNKYD